MAKQKSANDDALLQLFKKADKDNSGGLSKAELKDLLLQGNRHISQSQLDDVFEFFNSDDGDQVIKYDEFKKGLRKIQEFIQSIKELFDKFDTDKSGFLDKNELRKLLAATGQKFTEAEINEIFTRADPNGDNKISITEFTNAMA